MSKRLAAIAGLFLALPAPQAPASYDGMSSAGYASPFDIHDGGGSAHSSLSMSGRGSLAGGGMSDGAASALYRLYAGYLQRLPTPGPSPTASATPLAPPLPTAALSASPSPTQTPSPSPTATRSYTRTLTATRTSSRTATPTATSSATSTATRTPQPPGLGLAKTAAESGAFLGSRIHYFLVVSNSGPDPAQDVQVYDTLPDGTNFSGPGVAQSDGYAFNDAWRFTEGLALARGPFNLGAGQSVTLSLVVDVALGTPGQNLTNTAQAVDALFGQTAFSEAVVPLLPGVPSPTASSTMSPTFSASPSFTSSPSASPSPTRTASPSSTATPSASPTPTATPSATASRTPFPQLQLIKASSPSFVVSAGDLMTFVFTLQNNGSLSADSVSVWDSLPSNAAYLSGSGAASFASGVVSWTLPSLPASLSASFTYTALFSGSGSEVNSLGAAAASNHPQVASNADSVGVGAALTATNTPTPSPLPSASPTGTASPSSTATLSPTSSLTPSFTASPSPSATPVPPTLLVSLARDQGQSWVGGTDLRFSISITHTAGAEVSDLILRFHSDLESGNQFLDFLEVNSLLGPSDPVSPLAWRLFTGGIDGGVDMGTLGLAPNSYLPNPRRIFAKVVGGQGLTLTSRVVLSSAAFAVSVTQTVWTYVDFGPPAASTPVTAASPTSTPVAGLGRIVAYPQPAKDRVCFAYHAPAGGRLSLLVYNAAFQLVARIQGDALGGMKEDSCADISGMVSGIYFYQASVSGYTFPMGQFGIAK